MNPITQIRAHQRGIHPRPSVVIQDAFLLMLVFFWCLLTAGWPGRGFRGADEIYDQGGFDAYIEYQIVVWLTLFCILITILAVHTKTRKAVYDFFTSPSIKWFVIYIGWATICIIWSISPKLSAFYVIKTLAIVIVAALINMRISNPRQATRLICYWAGITSLSALASCFLWPDEFTGRLGPPLFARLFDYAGIGTIVAVNRTVSKYTRKVWLWGGVSLFFFAVLLLTRTRYAIVSASIASLSAIRMYRRGHIIIGYTIALLCFLIVASPSGVWGLFNRADMEAVDKTTIMGLNGRVELWAYVARELLNQDYLWGKGYIAGSRDWFSQDFLERGGSFAGTSPHNAWLNAWVETGVPGFLIAIILYCSLVRNAYFSIHKRYSENESIRYTAGWVVIMYVLFSVVTGGLTGGPGATLLIILLCMRWNDAGKGGLASSHVSRDWPGRTWRLKSEGCSRHLSGGR